MSTNSTWSRKLLELDAVYSHRLRVDDRHKSIRTLAVFFAHSGDSWFWLLGLGLLWFFGSEPWKTIALTMAIGIVLTASIVFVLKFTIRRPRPAGEWGAIYRKTDPHSFPSGHAARAVMLAVVAIGLGPTWFGIVMLIWAFLVILARVAMGVHYLSDVTAGAILGVGTGALSLYLYSIL